MNGQSNMNERLHGQHDPKLDVVISYGITKEKEYNYALQTSNFNYYFGRSCRDRTTE